MMMMRKRGQKLLNIVEVRTMRSYEVDICKQVDLRQLEVYVSRFFCMKIRGRKV